MRHFAARLLSESTQAVSNDCLLRSTGFASDAERHSGPKKKKARKEADSAAEASSAADLSSAHKAVKGTLKLKAAAPFSAPVSKEDVPGYSTVIQNPMDLGSIAEKLKKGGYTTTGERCKGLRFRASSAVLTTSQPQMRQTPGNSPCLHHAVALSQQAVQPVMQTDCALKPVFS